MNIPAPGSKIFVIGAGPIVIGQACEFDYSGCQACKVLKEQKFYTVLLNSNPATIMTDPQMTDAVYVEPMTVDTCVRIIEKERPQYLLPTMGGQTALNLTIDLYEAGIINKYGIHILGAAPEAIKTAENRSLFKNLVDGLGLLSLKSAYVTTLKDALNAVDHIPFPIILRPSFTLGGLGGTVVHTEDEYLANIKQALDLSPVGQVLVEQSCIGWKEIELELMKDGYGNTVVVCGIENLDPMGVHTGDSITVAPLQTVSDPEYQDIRNQSFMIMDKLGIQTGGANIQFAQDPDSKKFYVIEVNPRVSRSSALASKATGFPIAKIATLVAIGKRLDEIVNDITQKTPASFEPALDYVVVKIPKFNFEKFTSEPRELGVSMKAIGETMAIGRDFEESLMKGLRGISQNDDPIGAFMRKHSHLIETASDEQMRHLLGTPCPDRVFFIWIAFQKGYTLPEVHDLTRIHPWFLIKIMDMARLEVLLAEAKDAPAESLIRKAECFNWTPAHICRLTPGYQAPETPPTYAVVDTCAAEFESHTPYLYSTTSPSQDNIHKQTPEDKQARVLVIGSGPNQIGQGLEFDYTCVHAAWGIQSQGDHAIIINNNPETVSTDYDTADTLFFEPITPHEVTRCARAIDNLKGAIVMMGGQSAINIASDLIQHDIPIIGTDLEAIDMCEDRDRFRTLIHACKLRCPAGKIVHSIDELLDLHKHLPMPVIVRPSYIIGGADVQVFSTPEAIEDYIHQLKKRPHPAFPLMAESFLENAREYDCDIIRDEDGHIVIAGIMEHIEQAGIHSGDSTCVFPHYYSDPATIEQLEKAAYKVAQFLNLVGLINIQFAVQKDEIYVLEINPRASRTVPFLAKATGIPFAQIATQIVLGASLNQFFPLARKRFNMNRAHIPFYAVKKPVFPFNRFKSADVILGPQMKSTGEVMGIAATFYEAYEKAMTASSHPIPEPGSTFFISVCDEDKAHLEKLVRPLIQNGYKVVTTEGTHKHLNNLGIESQKIFKRKEGHPNVLDLVGQKSIGFIFNTTRSQRARLDELHIRRVAVRYGVPYSTNISEMHVIAKLIQNRDPERAVCSLSEYHRLISLGGRAVRAAIKAAPAATAAPSDSSPAG